MRPYKGKIQPIQQNVDIFTIKNTAIKNFIFDLSQFFGPNPSNRALEAILIRKVTFSAGTGGHVVGEKRRLCLKGVRVL